TTTHAAATPRLWWPRPNLCAGVRRAMFYRRRQWWGSTCPGADRSFLAPGGDLESGGAVVLQVDARVAAFDQGVLDLSQRTLQRGDDRFPIPGSTLRHRVQILDDLVHLAGVDVAQGRVLGSGHDDRVGARTWRIVRIEEQVTGRFLGDPQRRSRRRRRQVLVPTWLVAGGSAAGCQ